LLNLWYGVWKGCIVKPSSITISSNDTSISNPRLERQP
jgi:hypothetical protein